VKQNGIITITLKMLLSSTIYLNTPFPVIFVLLTLLEKPTLIPNSKKGLNIKFSFY